MFVLDSNTKSSQTFVISVASLDITRKIVALIKLLSPTNMESIFQHLGAGFGQRMIKSLIIFTQNQLSLPHQALKTSHRRMLWRFQWFGLPWGQLWGRMLAWGSQSTLRACEMKSCCSLRCWHHPFIGTVVYRGRAWSLTHTLNVRTFVTLKTKMHSWSCWDHRLESHR